MTIKLIKNAFALIVLLFSMTINAQERTITGVVSDDMGPVSDISVQVKGTENGTVTDFDGNYAIKAKTGDVLTFSHVSYMLVEKTVGKNNVINVTMTEGGAVLDEVVVTSYGRKRSKRTSTFLAGKVAGVKVTSSSGAVGSSARIVLRGASSLKRSEVKGIISKSKVKNSISKREVQNDDATRITSGEWNDLDHWGFWSNLLNEYSSKESYWNFNTQKRISVIVRNNNGFAINEKVEIKKKNTSVWKTKTDNFGSAELWIDLFKKNKTLDLSDYSLYIANQKMDADIKFFENGINEFIITSEVQSSNKVELAFIVDATGSMGDELEFLKDDLKSVIRQVERTNSDLAISTAAVFYRDIDDDYVVRKSNFTKNVDKTVKFIAKQNASGGGDFPEAVHSAVKTAVNELQWSDDAKTRIAFLLLDAPPHYDDKIISQLHKDIKMAAQKGIKLIPIVASGINKNTEFLMRFFAIATNGTYVFITDDSGIGNPHLKASTGDFKVEKLNKAMVRLIHKYSK